MEKTRQFPVIIEQDRGGTYIVECSVFEGCRSYGDTMHYSRVFLCYNTVTTITMR